jgi:hexokinase
MQGKYTPDRNLNAAWSLICRPFKYQLEKLKQISQKHIKLIQHYLPILLTGQELSMIPRYKHDTPTRLNHCVGI